MQNLFALLTPSIDLSIVFCVTVSFFLRLSVRLQVAEPYDRAGSTHMLKISAFWVGLNLRLKMFFKDPNFFQPMFILLSISLSVLSVRATNWPKNTVLVTSSNFSPSMDTVSYTHLTLPTIYSV